MPPRRRRELCIEMKEKIPTRFNVAVMLFMACFISYMLRVNISINILAMVEPTNLHENKTLAAAPDYGPRYNWTSTEQSYLLGAFFWGYLVTSLPGGTISEWLGGKDVVTYSMALSAIFTAIVPMFSSLSVWIIFVIRLLTGVAGGVLYPAMHNLISKWAPPNEKGKFVATLLGGTFGTVITWPLAGYLTESFGWVYAFYVPAAITAVVTLIWHLLVSDTPSNHPRIQNEEKDYISKAIGESLSNKKSLPPFLSLITSLPFHALNVLHYGNMWGMFFLLTAAPKFMSEVLGFKLSHAGILASLPYLARFISGFIFGAIGDTARKNEWMSVTAIRKFFCIFSHIIPGLLLIGLTYVGSNPYVCVAMITLSLGFNGASTVTNLQNSQDLAPNYAGTLYGIINFCGTTTGFITPLVVGYFTQDRNTIDEWSIIFTIGAVVYIIPALIFVFFGSGKIQPWNDHPAKTVSETVDVSTSNSA
ncbi:Sialin [Pseudolycoriella hygida]|uniref:Sialin n=1 Tax=Pseudolycoriella hygida TaxID=35572 RepID=A0A9Q0S680_9DIPT|nr:Sialin [Pseudolycoriella hygida]